MKAVGSIIVTLLIGGLTLVSTGTVSAHPRVVVPKGTTSTITTPTPTPTNGDCQDSTCTFSS
jgi:hypothetical protein